MMKLHKLAVIISCACALLTGCASVRNNLVQPDIPLVQHEPDHLNDYARVAKDVYPAAYTEFVNQLQVVDVKPMTDGVGVQITYRTSVSDEMFDTLTKSFSDMNEEQLAQYCSVRADEFAPVYLTIDGKSGHFTPVKTANYYEDENTKSWYDALAFDRRICSGGKAQWVFIDMTKTRNFPLGLYSPAMIHVYRDGRFYTEITPGFVPQVNKDNNATLYGLFLMRGEHEFTVNYPTGDKHPERLERFHLTVKKEHASFN